MGLLGNLISAGVQSGAGYLRGQNQGNEIEYERGLKQQQLQRQATLDAQQRQNLLQEAALREAQIAALGRRDQPKPVTPFNALTDPDYQRRILLQHDEQEFKLKHPTLSGGLTPDASQRSDNESAEGQGVLQRVPKDQQLGFMTAYGQALKAAGGKNPNQVALHVWRGMSAADPTVKPARPNPNAFGGPSLTGNGPAGGPTVGQAAQNPNLPDSTFAPSAPVAPPKAQTPNAMPGLSDADVQQAKQEPAYADWLRKQGYQIP